jgi:putative heme-binding domain-containing protein
LPKPQGLSVLERAIELGHSQGDRADRELAQIASANADDRWIRAAVLSSVGPNPLGLLLHLRSEAAEHRDSEGELALVGELGRMVAILGRAQGEKFEVAAVLDRFKAESFDFRAALLCGIVGTLRTRETRDAEAFGRAIVESVELLANRNTDLPRQLRAIRVLALDELESGSSIRLLALAEDSTLPEEIRAAAIRALAQDDNPNIASSLIGNGEWARQTPAIRETLLTSLCSHSAHHAGLLAAIESGALPASALNPQRREIFLKHKDPAIRERAEKLFSAAESGDRQKAFEDAKAALALAVNATHGSAVFKAHCATCHRLEREGVGVGPDLLDIRNQPKESILFHIVVPDAEIAPAFAAYLAETKDGRAFSGILSSETPNAVALRMPGGTEETLLRANLAKLEALPNSLMPSGLDAAMSRQDLADLIGFLKGER